MNNGDDTAYYLSRGHRVVAIEANPILAKEGAKRFAAEITAGRLKILAQSLAGRSALAPDVPSYTELGYPDFVGKTSFGFFVKTGTPRALVEQYSKAITEALRAADTAKRLNDMGLEVAGGTPEGFHKVLQDDRNRWAPIAKQAGIKLD